ncbi:MAG: hypothetical protein PHI60_08910 [Candidatus Omnitrophica bacterium]|nr:hypothetical protein [Candidatus Omnitrophota bacterium]
MNFIDILTGKKKGTPAEIAGQIVELEAQLTEYRVQKDKAWQEAKSLRQQKMGGGKVAQADIARADQSITDAELNIAAAEESLDGLRKKLQESVSAATQARLRKISQELETARVKKLGIVEEIIATAGQLKALQLSLNPEIISGPEGVSAFFPNLEERKKFQVAFESAQAAMTGKSYFEETRELKEEERRLSSLDITAECEKMLEDKRAGQEEAGDV